MSVLESSGLGIFSWNIILKQNRNELSAKHLSKQPSCGQPFASCEGQAGKGQVKCPVFKSPGRLDELWL